MKGVLKQAFSLATSQVDSFVKVRLFTALTLVLFTSVLAALAPIALKYAVDALNSAEPISFDAPASLAMFTNSPFIVGPIALVSIYLISLWASRSLGELRWFLYGTADQRLHRNLSRHLFGHVMNLPMSFHLDRKTGALNQTLIQGLSGYSILLNHAIFTLLPVLVEILIISVVLTFFFKVEFLLILLASVLAYSGAFIIGVRQIVKPSQKVASAQIDAFANLTDSILNTETVKYFTAEQHVNNRYDTALASSEKHWANFYWCKSTNGLLIALVFTLSLGSAILLGVQQVIAGTMTIGDFVLVNAYMLQIVRPMEMLGAAFRDIAYGVAFIEKMTELMARKTEDTGTPALNTDESTTTGAGKLAFEAVTFSYLPGRLVMKDISFIVPSGKTTGIVGSSGSGKSSLIRLLMRLYDPNDGDIYLNGTSTRNMPLDLLRRAIAIVPQDTVLFNDTIAYNIGFGKEDCTQADIERAAQIAHIHDKIIAMADGYETIVGERGLKLSGGEKQRVSIARAALKQPQMFVFDEATSSLDTKTEQGILDNLIEVSKGMTTLIIAHRLSTVIHADEILVIDQGRIAERGSHSALLIKNGLYASMWHTQQHGQTRKGTHKEIA